jgi:NADPH2:quinone reductase
MAEVFPIKHLCIFSQYLCGSMQFCTVPADRRIAPSNHHEVKTMALVVRMTAPGGVEKLAVGEETVAAPGPGEILVHQTAIGVNFIDIYHRSGLYPLPALPAVLGVEGTGVVAAVGPDVIAPKLGERVAYAGAPIGAYASERLLPAWRAVPLPPSLDDPVAATALGRGLTAHMLMTRVHPVRPGTTILVHAAAGGLGTLLTKWANHKGATVIGTVGSEAKAAIARAAGADHLIVGRDADFVLAVMALTGGRGVDFAVDGIGGSTLAKTFACVRPFGTVASIGQSGGPIPAVPVDDLGPRRSISLARPSVMAYMNERQTYQQAAAEVIEAVCAGISPSLAKGYPLREAAAAQAELEAGRSTGCLYLVP